MTIKYLKKAIKTPSSDDHKTREAVQNILNDIEKRREEAIKEITKKFDKYDNEVNRPTLAMFQFAPLSELCTFLSYESLDELMKLGHIEHSRDTIIDDFITPMDSSS